MTGLWSGADPRIVTLRRERDEARLEIKRLKGERKPDPPPSAAPSRLQTMPPAFEGQR